LFKDGLVIGFYGLSPVPGRGIRYHEHGIFTKMLGYPGGIALDKGFGPGLTNGLDLGNVLLLVWLGSGLLLGLAATQADPAQPKQ
jgi:hypothetical protein